MGIQLEPAGVVPARLASFLIERGLSQVAAAERPGLGLDCLPDPGTVVRWDFRVLAHGNARGLSSLTVWVKGVKG